MSEVVAIISVSASAVVGIGGVVAAAWGSSRERRWQSREERTVELRTVLDGGGSLVAELLLLIDEAHAEVRRNGKLGPESKTNLEREARLIPDHDYASGCDGYNTDRLRPSDLAMPQRRDASSCCCRVARACQVCWGSSGSAAINPNISSSASISMRHSATASGTALLKLRPTQLAETRSAKYAPPTQGRWLHSEAANRWARRHRA